MSRELVWAILTTAPLGVFAKYADPFNDNGMREPLRGASLLSGTLWGGFGALQVALVPFAAVTCVTHILYWLLQVKLEQVSHAITGVAIVLAAVTDQAQFFANHRCELLAILLGYMATGYLHAWLKRHSPASRAFLRLGLRIYLVPFVYALYTARTLPIVATIAGMIRCDIVIRYCRGLKDTTEELLIRQRA